MTVTMTTVAYEVRWHPPTEKIADGPIDRATGRVDLRANGWPLTPKAVAWEGLDWAVAISQNLGCLWVVHPDRKAVEVDGRQSLARLALHIAEYGVGTLGVPIGRGIAPKPTAPLAAPEAPQTVESKRKAALDAITVMVSRAISHGATDQDIRLAVWSAMGLDDPESN